MKVKEEQLVREYLDRLGQPEEIVRAALEEQPTPLAPPAPAPAPVSSPATRVALIVVGVVGALVVLMMLAGVVLFMSSGGTGAPPVPQ
ncbi:hypothetical protein GCM10022247_18800 [Allokutzneria multivorans]|uniref:Uncharacterized protein n=1 Tax=Allokutzneria multivorans TaxID=1142134 RepID=A0ABP7RKH1_9PSEU